jgi:hypothetical protein
MPVLEMRLRNTVQNAGISHSEKSMCHLSFRMAVAVD